MRVIDRSQDENNDNLTKLESKTRTQFLPELTGRVSPREVERSELELTARLGGLIIINLKTDAAQKIKSSEKLCKSLIEKLCQVILIKTELQIGRNVHLLKYRRRANRINYVFLPNKRMMLCCSRL